MPLFSEVIRRNRVMIAWKGCHSMVLPDCFGVLQWHRHVRLILALTRLLTLYVYTLSKCQPKLSTVCMGVFGMLTRKYPDQIQLYQNYKERIKINIKQCGSIWNHRKRIRRWRQHTTEGEMVAKSSASI